MRWSSRFKNSMPTFCQSTRFALPLPSIASAATGRREVNQHDPCTWQELFSLNVPSVVGLVSVLDQSIMDRVHHGIIASLLALKKRPQVRYQRSSEMALRLAEQVFGTMETEGELFGFRKPEIAPLLLLLDRRDDPVTPLLNQWTYQAMVHELLGVNNNRVDISTVPDLPKDMPKEVVLSPEQDTFFAQNMFLNYGELAENVKLMMDQFQAKTKQSKALLIRY